MQSLRTIALGLMLVVGIVAAASASDRLVLFEYFNNTS